MKIYKKITALFLCLCLCVSLFAACKDTGTPDAPTSELLQGEESPTTEPLDLENFFYGENEATVRSDYAVQVASPDDEVMRLPIAIDGAGNSALTNREFQIYYWIQFYDFMNTYGDYAYYFGLDYNTPLSEQDSLEENHSWEQYFIKAAVQHFSENYALAQLAYENGYVISDEDAATIEEIAANSGSFYEEAVSYGYENGEQYIKANFGQGVDLAAYQDYLRLYYATSTYYNELADAYESTIKDEDIAAYYDANAASYLEKRILNRNNVTVRHILIEPVKDETTGEADEAAWKEAEDAINEVYALWQQNPTEEYFAELVPIYSSDSGSVESGGLYEDFDSTKMVEAFTDWCFYEGRVAGETGIVQTEYGYHLIYFVEQTENTSWKDHVLKDMIYAHMDGILAEAMEKYPVRFDYSKIAVFDMITEALSSAQEEEAPVG